jgi:cysteine desulfurase
MPAVYLDCAATTPLEARVRDEMLRYLDRDFGNAGSRTHDFGAQAWRAVERARDRVAAVAGVSRGDVVFTSGATESNNLAILGLARHGEATGRRHIVSTRIEHHAVLEPLRVLRRRGFEVDLIAPNQHGVVRAADVMQAIRRETLLVSVMHVNNETGMRQPIAEVADALDASDVVFHVDAAQSFGREIDPLRHPRIDLISASGHKIFGPKGIGALIVRRRQGGRPRLEPLMHGGGQERGLRPGTLPVHQIVGFGTAAEIALQDAASRAARCGEFRERLLAGLRPLGAVINGDPGNAVPHIVNLAIPGLDGEAVIELWRECVAISQGAACTSQSYTCSHVLGAMAVPSWQQDGAIRLSWCHLTPMPDLDAMVAAAQATDRSIGSASR